MRIIGGKYKGRVLAEFKGNDVRPTSDRAKEALFNILAFRLIGARVLDLFAGSGALGLESLSRGAKEVVFNDYSKNSLSILQKNLQTLKIGGEAIVKNLDYTVCLGQAFAAFDVIFIDPPYREEYGERALKMIAERGLLSENGVIVYERDVPFTEEIDGLERTDERKYGRTIFTFFKKA